MKNGFFIKYKYLILFGIALMFASGMTGLFPLTDGFATEWKQASGKRLWHFPRDHGAHRDYLTEWWYFTGNLVDAKKDKYGYQLTFFRRGIRRKTDTDDNPWDVKEIYLAHFALTDAKRNSFRFFEQISRNGPGLAGAKNDALDVWCLNWSARMERGKIYLDVLRGNIHLKLELSARKYPVLHGVNGLSKKGPLPGQASWYYSVSDLVTKGTLTTAEGIPVAVAGTSWFDQEFGSNQLGKDQAGWDWFALHLSDGREVMLYLMRKKDGTVEPVSSGTYIDVTGTARHLELAEIGLEVIGNWVSRHSGARYPSRWRITIPSAKLELIVSPIVADQELDTAASTGVVYYEGAITGEGTSFGKPVTCDGYVELTGYAGSLGGIF